MNDQRIDKEEIFYRGVKSFSKLFFESVTRLTLTGFLIQVAITSGSEVILTVALFLVFLVILNVVLDLMLPIRNIRSLSLNKKLGWIPEVVIFVLVFSPIIIFIQYVVVGGMAELFEYYATLANR
ncbi:hypothetical protein [Vreelandella sp. GE22]